MSKSNAALLKPGEGCEGQADDDRTPRTPDTSDADRGVLHRSLESAHFSMNFFPDMSEALSEKCLQQLDRAGIPPVCEALQPSRP